MSCNFRWKFIPFIPIQSLYSPFGKDDPQEVSIYAPHSYYWHPVRSCRTTFTTTYIKIVFLGNTQHHMFFTSKTQIKCITTSVVP